MFDLGVARRVPFWVSFPPFGSMILAAHRCLWLLLPWLAGGAALRAQSLPASVPLSGTVATAPRINTPTLPRLGYTSYPWKTDITATVFWVGEQPTANNPTPNHKSSWDTEWQKNYGGYDDPDPLKRGRDYCPIGFTPGLNPFYVALPYNDCINHTQHKPEAARVIPWFKQMFTKPGKTVLRGTWLAIRYGNRVCYAQWEDCGPFVTDDHEYVFGNARPKNTNNKNAGIDLSPAVRDYLGIPSGGKCDWRFVNLNEVPPGPWRSLGANNHFVRMPEIQRAKANSQVASRLEELRRMRDAYFRQNGSSQVR
jgi:hypothetical protein